MEERLRNEVEALIGTVDKTHLRGLRKESFLCSAKCCDTTDNHEALQMCVDNCQRKVAEAENIVSSELQQFQGRLQRCVLACKDDVEASAPANIDAAQQAQLQAKVDVCALKCVDDQIATLPAMKKRIDGTLTKLH